MAKEWWGICCVGTSPSSSPHPHSNSLLGTICALRTQRSGTLSTGQDFLLQVVKQLWLCEFSAKDHLFLANKDEQESLQGSESLSCSLSRLSSWWRLLPLRRLSSAQTARPVATPDCSDLTAGEEFRHPKDLQVQNLCGSAPDEGMRYLQKRLSAAVS